MAPFNEVKKALEEAKGSEQDALHLLKKRGKVIADKKSARETKAGVVMPYTHRDGKIGVLVVLRCETDFVAKTPDFQTLARDVAMHIAAMKPKYIKPESIPEEARAAEQKVFEEQTKEMGKPAAMTAQIVEGKMKKYYDEVCLLNQPFVKDDSKTVMELIAEYVGKLGENIEVGAFTRFEI